MSNLKKTTIWVLLLVPLGLFSCKESPDPVLEAEGYVIGFDPCIAGVPNDEKGYLIKTKTDTLLTYNLPSDLYDFPPELFANYITWYLFPLSEQDKYKVKIKYRPASESEKVYSLCIHIINTGGFNFKQFYILEANKN